MMSDGEYQDALDALDRNDYPTAARLLKPLAEQGDLLPGPRRRDLAAAAKWFREAAAQGHAGAHSALAAMPDQPGTWRGMMSRLWGGDQTQPG